MRPIHLNSPRTYGDMTCTIKARNPGKTGTAHTSFGGCTLGMAQFIADVLVLVVYSSGRGLRVSHSQHLFLSFSDSCARDVRIP